MAQMMTPFRCIEFYDVPRCIVVRYRGILLLLQSAFDEEIDEYPNTYLEYVLPKEAEESLTEGSWTFLEETPMDPVPSVPTSLRQV
jgi:hypothetical protein